MATVTIPESLQETLTRFDLQLIETIDGGFSVYRMHSSLEHGFDNLDELATWLRWTLPEICLNEIREVLHGIAEIASLLDPENSRYRDNPFAVCMAIRRLCYDGLRQTEYLEIAQANARREARDERED